MAPEGDRERVCLYICTYFFCPESNRLGLGVVRGVVHGVGVLVFNSPYFKLWVEFKRRMHLWYEQIEAGLWK